MSVANLLHLDYWFTQPYIAHGGVMWFWVLSFLFLILAGLLLKIAANYQMDNLAKEVYRRFSNIGATVGILGLLWMFFRQERIPFFAWRFWLWFLALIFFWWLAKAVNYTVRRLPEIKAEKVRREMMARYLPKRK